MNTPPTPGQPQRARVRFFSVVVWGLAWSPMLTRVHGAEPDEIRYAAPRKLGELQHPAIVESSGIAVSRRRPDRFWTHNDSGDSPRLFAFDRQGKHLGEFPAPEARAVDWEDMASFVFDGRPYLLVADVGDNSRRRKECTLYWFDEPQLADKTVRLVRTIPFRYEDGPHDCEGVAVDPAGPDAYLVTKEFRGEATIFRLPLPHRAPNEPLVAKAVARRKIPLATGMDISADGRRAVIGTYLFGYDFTRRDGEDWSAAFSRSGRPLTLPERTQGESIGYGADSRTLYLTSEQSRSPLWEIVPER